MTPTQPFRPMTVQDLDAVMAIEQRAYAFPWTRGNITDSLAAGHEAWLLMSTPEATDATRRADRPAPELLGYYLAMPGFEELHLLNITVRPELQGRGHARTMLAHLAARAVALASPLLWLEVRESNARARALYERWGFETAGLRKGYYPAGHGQREDAIVMRLALQADEPEASS